MSSSLKIIAESSVAARVLDAWIPCAEQSSPDSTGIRRIQVSGLSGKVRPQTFFGAPGHPIISLRYEDPPNAALIPDASVTVIEMGALCHELVAATMTLEHYPPSGYRHEAMLVLAGALAHARWSLRRAEAFMRRVVLLTGDTKLGNRLSGLADTYARLAGGQSVRGGPSLIEGVFPDQATLRRFIRELRLANPKSPDPLPELPQDPPAHEPEQATKTEDPAETKDTAGDASPGDAPDSGSQSEEAPAEEHADAGLTVEQVARGISLPIEYLTRDWQLSTIIRDGRSGVRIPYLNETGKITSIRMRWAMTHGPSTFTWRVDDQVLLYGLGRYAEIKTAGEVVLLEGETDTFVSWYYGIPALGIPGKLTWNARWARFFDGIKTYIWMEPQAHDLIVRVATSLPDLLVITPPEGLKDLREAHQRGEDIAKLMATLKAGAMPARELMLVGDELRRRAQRAQESRTHRYRVTPQGLVLVRTVSGLFGEAGTVDIPLTNFVATIVADVFIRDGTGDAPHIEYEIAAHVGPRHARFLVPEALFAGLGWATQHLGSGAIVYAGMGVRDHARTAIQCTSLEKTSRDIYEHLGWTKIEGQWTFLHTGGGITAAGLTAEVSVRLPEALERFALPAPPPEDVLREAVRTSLRLVGTAADQGIAPDTVVFPLHAAVFRATLGPTQTVVMLIGGSGRGKSVVAVLFQDHFGDWDEEHLPSSWISTGNYLELYSFMAKDCMLMVDDFSPSGGLHDIAKQHREADRLYRSQANRSGRGRLRSDASMVSPKPPRSLLVGTGEDLPRGQSLRARIYAIDYDPDAVHWDQVTERQRLQEHQLRAQCLSGFVCWLATRYNEVTTALPERRLALREAAIAAVGESAHKKTPTTISDLAVGYEVFLAFARETGAITDEESKAYWSRAWTAFISVGQAQADHQQASDPARRFLEMLGELIVSKQAHLAALDEGAPDDPTAWGWRVGRAEESGDGEDDGGETVSADARPAWPCGPLLGWVDGDDVYLLAEVAYGAVQRLASTSGEAIPISLRMLKRRLDEGNWLASTDHRSKRKRYEIRRPESTQGHRPPVLHLKAASLGGGDDVP
jgi:hypothetical protein